MPSIGEVAAGLGLEAVGDVALTVTGAAHPGAATATELALAMDRKYLPALASGAARAAMVAPDTDWRAHGLTAAILAPRARYALAGVTSLFAHELDLAPGVHESASVDLAASLGPDAWVGPFAVIGPGARVGAGARIGAQTFIGRDVVLGEGVVLHPGARVLARCRLGDRVMVHANAVIGGDGFSFVTPEKGSVETAKEQGVVAAGAENRIWARIHSLGAVEIGDDVEIGAGAMVDRGTVADTRIGAGAKIDNLVQIGHNVVIGENALLCGQAGVAGSAVIGDRVVIGGKSGVADHVTIGSDCLVMAGSAVGTHVRPRSIVGGAPAMPREELGRLLMSLKRLPRLIEDFRTLKKRLSNDDRSG